LLAQVNKKHINLFLLPSGKGQARKIFDSSHGAHADRAQQGLYRNDREQNIFLSGAVHSP